MDQYMTVASFNDRGPADALTTKLREAGFADADLFDESDAQKWLLLNITPKAQFRVRVHRDEAERALTQMKQWEAEDPTLMNQAVRCPQCASARVEYPQFSRRTLMSALPAAAAAVGLIDKDFYCEACGFTWNPDQKPDAPRDVLNWPTGEKPVGA